MAAHWSNNRESRLRWLLQHPTLWAHAPSDSQDVDDAGHVLIVAIGKLMVKAGLYSKTTDVRDRSWGLRVLIGEARRRLA